MKKVLLLTGILLWLSGSLYSQVIDNSAPVPDKKANANDTIPHPALSKAPTTTAKVVDTIPRDVEKRIKAFAIKSNPKAEEQANIISMQNEGYHYMEAVPDTEVKVMSVAKYPDNYAMQKYYYEKQLNAKNYMKTVSDEEVKQIAMGKHPHDYNMQKETYGKEVKAKYFMSTTPDSNVKEQVEHEYPNDYTMQKYAYDKLIFGAENR